MFYTFIVFFLVSECCFSFKDKEITGSALDNSRNLKSIHLTNAFQSRKGTFMEFFNKTKNKNWKSSQIQGKRIPNENNLIVGYEMDDYMLKDFNLVKKVEGIFRGKKSMPPFKRRGQKGQKRRRFPRAVVAKKERLWDYGVIPYEIDNIFSNSHKVLFKRSMAYWEKFTCIKFVERDPKEHPNYVYFTVQDCGCCAYVGKMGKGRQSISIGQNCEKFGIVLHELGHVIGFWHEHTRTDRDQHIQINETNIAKGQKYNFDKLSHDEVDSRQMPYDFKSIMHYAKNTFSKSIYLDTIVPKTFQEGKLPEMGQRTNLSDGDIVQANLLYNCPKCGQTIQGSSGEILSPFYLKQSQIMKSEYCEWRITAPLGERIILSIKQLNLLEASDCSLDYLEIRDGYWFKSPLIKRICGSITTTLNLTSDSNKMLLTYKNNNVLNGFAGFIAEYDVICGGDLFVANEQRVDSPNYPLKYPPKKECIWRVTVPEGYEVAIKFHWFELENHESCIYDYVEIRDCNNSDSDLIGKFCGNKIPPNIKTNSNKIFMKFSSDASAEEAGFSVTFTKELDECKTATHGCEQQCINFVGGYECECHAGYALRDDGRTCKDTCGGVIEAESGFLSSPESYRSPKQCVWEILAPEKHNVFLNFTYFHFTEIKSLECKIDYIRIYSKFADSRLRKIGTFCGTKLPPVIKTETNILRVEFHVRRSERKGSFSANFSSDIDECATNNGGCQHYCENTFGSYNCLCQRGYTLQSDHHSCTEPDCKFEIGIPSGIVFSPNYPGSYPKNAYCYWHFKTLLGHKIALNFNEFEVEEHQECIYDYVAAYDGSLEDSSTLGIYCNGRPPYSIISSGNELLVILKTDNNVQRKGFIATHSTDCGGYLRTTNESQTFYSHPNFGQKKYDKNMHCTWKFQTDSDKSIQLIFKDFEIEYSRKCEYDFVEIYEEIDFIRNPYYGKFCGLKNPVPIISSTDTLFVYFKTDYSTDLNGFSATFIAVDPPENEVSKTTKLVTPFPGYLTIIDEQNLYDEYREFDYEDTDMSHFLKI